MLYYEERCFLMKSLIAALFILSISASALAATVGSPEITIPEQSLYLKQEAVNKALDRTEFNMNIKASMEIEFIIKRKLASADDVSDVELEGSSIMFKFSNNFYDIIEPYIKIGSSSFKVKWDQHDSDIEIETDPGFIWGMGAKAKLHEFKDYGVKLTLDVQCRDIDLDVDKGKIGGSTTTASAIDGLFKIKEWQTTLLASKKYIFPMGANDYYIVPYGGMTYSFLNVDASFTQSTTGALYSTYDASDENVFGIVLGCDIMPFFLSYYLLNFELRLMNETALTLGGTVKF